MGAKQAGFWVVASDSAFKPLITRKTEGVILVIVVFLAGAVDDESTGELSEALALL